ncbi:MAG: hypothetical protein ABI828_05020 [Actinomycetota bacterium]
MHRSTARISVGLVALAVLTAPLAADAGVRSHDTAVTHRRAHALHVGQLGAIPVRGSVAKADTRSAASKKLEYHGGPVMLSSHTYTIFWEPTTCGTDPCYVDPGYNAGINTYFADVAADSGGNQNVYSTLNQYYQVRHHHKNHIRYQQTFADSFVDPHVFPSNGCPGTIYGATNVCLNDKQIRHEVKRVIIDRGWDGSKTNAFFLVLPKQVDTCFSASGATCAFTDFCAYHSAFALPDNSPAIYANIPYGGTNLAGCASRHGAPNNADLDATLNATSHEHREMTNDPFGTGWWDSQSGNEGSDQCAYKFGTLSNPGGPLSGDYNQVINGNDYLVQMEWSNRSLKCLQRGA